MIQTPISPKLAIKTSYPSLDSSRGGTASAGEVASDACLDGHC